MKPQEKASRRRLLTQKAIEKKLTRLTSLEAQLAGAEAALKATGARRIELSSKVDQLKEQRSRRSLAGNVIR
jgi:hypothetical protein